MLILGRFNLSTAIVAYGLSFSPEGHRFVPFRFVALLNVFDGVDLTCWLFVAKRNSFSKVRFKIPLFLVAPDAISQP